MNPKSTTKKFTSVECEDTGELDEIIGQTF